LAKAKQKAQLIRCLSNNRQWGLAMHIYLSDNSDALPHDGTFFSTGQGPVGQYGPDVGGPANGNGMPDDPNSWLNLVPQDVGDLQFQQYYDQSVASNQSVQVVLPFPGNGVG